MKKMMSMIRAKKARLATAVLAAAMTMSMAAPMVAAETQMYISRSVMTSRVIRRIIIGLSKKRTAHLTMSGHRKRLPKPGRS